MTKRAIIILPQFGSDTNLIQDIRDLYDPLANKIAAHITVVFPFESEISSNELRQHIESSLEGFKAFNLSMQGISHEENYLFLNVIKGREDIIRIHDLLYSGLIKRFLDEEQIYKPHLTVGRFENSDACKAAVNKLEYFDYKLETKISKITAEIILDDLSSQIEMSLHL